MAKWFKDTSIKKENRIDNSVLLQQTDEELDDDEFEVNEELIQEVLPEAQGEPQAVPENAPQVAPQAVPQAGPQAAPVNAPQAVPEVEQPKAAAKEEPKKDDEKAPKDDKNKDAKEDKKEEKKEDKKKDEKAEDEDEDEEASFVLVQKTVTRNGKKKKIWVARKIKSEAVEDEEEVKKEVNKEEPKKDEKVEAEDKDKAVDKKEKDEKKEGEGEEIKVQEPPKEEQKEEKPEPKIEEYKDETAKPEDKQRYQELNATIRDKNAQVVAYVGGVLDIIDKDKLQPQAKKPEQVEDQNPPAQGEDQNPPVQGEVQNPPQGGQPGEGQVEGQVPAAQEAAQAGEAGPQQQPKKKAKSPFRPYMNAMLNISKKSGTESSDSFNEMLMHVMAQINVDEASKETEPEEMIERLSLIRKSAIDYYKTHNRFHFTYSGDTKLDIAKQLIAKTGQLIAENKAKIKFDVDNDEKFAIEDADITDDQIKGFVQDDNIGDNEISNPVFETHARYDQGNGFFGKLMSLHSFVGLRFSRYDKRLKKYNRKRVVFGYGSAGFFKSGGRLMNDFGSHADQNTETEISKQDFKNVIRAVGENKGLTYHLLTNNCNHFTKKMAEAAGVDTVVDLHDATSPSTAGKNMAELDGQTIMNADGKETKISNVMDAKRRKERDYTELNKKEIKDRVQPTAYERDTQGRANRDITKLASSRIASQELGEAFLGALNVSKMETFSKELKDIDRIELLTNKIGMYTEDGDSDFNKVMDSFMDAREDTPETLAQMLTTVLISIATPNDVEAAKRRSFHDKLELYRKALNEELKQDEEGFYTLEPDPLNVAQLKNRQHGVTADEILKLKEMKALIKKFLDKALERKNARRAPAQQPAQH